MKKLLSVFLALSMLLSLGLVAGAEWADGETGVLPDIAGENGTTYANLFEVILSDDCYEIWYDYCSSVVGDEAAADTVAFLQAAISSDLYGEKAIEAFADGGTAFDCWYINGVDTFTFEGNTITTTLTDGSSETHTYEYLGQYMIGENESMIWQGMEIPVGFYCDVYQSTDEAGEFNYFFLRDDTMDETWHIEFRYGRDLEELQGYFVGPYAYWLAAGIDVEADAETIDGVIGLFCLENLGGEEVAEPIEIATAEELASISGNLSGDYILTADIDLAGINWTPIGTYVPSGESEEEQEIPHPDYAFTGTFDGQGHTIRNLTVSGEDGIAVGLFGCVANTCVGNFTLENADVSGTLMVSDVVGYSFCSEVYDVTLVNGRVTAYGSEISGEGMYGGVVGAGMGSRIVDCAAEAAIVIPDDTANAGIVGGGLELTSVVGCTAMGSVTAGNRCYGLGGVSGCGFGAEEFTDCAAADVVITAGDDCYWIGGITGYAGGYEDEMYGVPVTVFSNCVTENVEIVTGENADGIGKIVGAGFFSELAAAYYGAPFDQASVYKILDPAA